VIPGDKAGACAGFQDKLHKMQENRQKGNKTGGNKIDRKSFRVENTGIMHPQTPKHDEYGKEYG
jgi:hypothetical protein